MNPWTIATTMAKRGLFTPTWPHRQLGQVVSLFTWGFTLIGEVRQAAQVVPNQVAILDEDRGTVTYAALFERGIRAAAALRDLGIAPGDRIALLARNHVGAVEVMLGASALGVDLVLANTGMSGPQLAAMAREHDVRLLVHDAEFGSALAEMPDELRCVDDTAFAAAVRGAREVDRGIPSREGRIIILTSGTTGAPRGAERRAVGGVGPLVSIIDRIPLHAGDRVHIAAPLFHTWGFAALQLSLGMHATIVLRRRFEATATLDALAEHRCEVLFAVPVMAQRMLDSLGGGAAGAGDAGGAGLGAAGAAGSPRHTARQRMPRLRVVALSGSRLPAGFAGRFMDEFGEVLYNLYGSTEASWICIATPADLRRDPDTAGRPPLGTVVQILDGEGREVPEGQVGRVFCGNDLTFEGYTSGEAREFVAGMVSTGDLGHIRDGLYYVDGREDDMIVSGGENVYPGAVEGLIAELPAVLEVAVVGVPDADFGERLAAFVVRRPGMPLSAKAVRSRIRAVGARHLVPREVVFLAALPRNAAGKVMSSDLRAHPQLRRPPVQ